MTARCALAAALFVSGALTGSGSAEPARVVDLVLAPTFNGAAQGLPARPDAPQARQDRRWRVIERVRVSAHTQAKAHQASSADRGAPSRQDWARLRWCESGRDGSWRVSSSSRARGLYQFLRSTWRSVGGTGDPARASRAEQQQRALTLWRRDGWAPWLASSTCTGLR